MEIKHFMAEPEEVMTIEDARRTLNDIRLKYKNGILCIYEGSLPNSLDFSENGNLLLEITAGGGGFVPGNSMAGLNFDGVIFGKRCLYLCKKDDEDWFGFARDSGRPGYFRFYDNTYRTGISELNCRFQGTVGGPEEGADLTLAPNFEWIQRGIKVTIGNFRISLPFCSNHNDKNRSL